MASIKDVAKKAGVGVGTVSRVLNNSGYVSEETKNRILQAIEELDYTPNELARNLLKSKTGIVAIIIPDLNHPFFSTFSRLAEIELYNAGFKTMICSTVEIGNREQEYLDLLQRKIVDGIITASHTLDNDAYQKVEKPIVAFDRDLGPNIPLISSNHEYGGRIAAEKLIENGCKKVMVIKEAGFISSPSNQRYKDFASVLRNKNIDLIMLETDWNNFDYDYTSKIVYEYLNMHPDVDGIFTSDITGIYCSNILQDMGKKIPENIRIIGYDATYVTKMHRPILTCVRQNIPALASACVKTILQLINDETDVPQKQIFNVDWQFGGTTL